MNIRIKVKHLVLFLLLPLILLTVIGLTHPWARADLGPAQQASADARTALLQKLEASSGSARMQLIRETVVEPDSSYPAYWFNVYAGSSMSRVSQPQDEEISPLLPVDRIKLLEEYIQAGPADYSMQNAVKQLVYEYDAAGSTGNQADQAIVAALGRVSGKSSAARELTLLRAERALNAGKFAQAGELLAQQEYTVQYNESELDARAAWLQGRLLFAQGKGSEALELVNSALEEYRKVWAERDAALNPAGSSSQQNASGGADDGIAASGSADGSGTDSGSNEAEQSSTSSLIEEQLAALQTALQEAVKLGFNAPAALSGTLTKSDGTPVARAGIFLRAESELYHSVSYDSEPYQIVTDGEGHFQFSGVIPGFYQIQLGLSFEQIDGWTWPVQSDDWIELQAGSSVIHDITLQPLLELQSPVNSQVLTGDTVQFKWEAVEGAAYYNLSTTVDDNGGLISHITRQRITDNQVAIPVTELYNSGGFSTGSSGGGWQSVSPASLLGFADPDSRFSWSIDAYDAQDRVITRSNGYRLNEETVGNLPFFYLKSRTMTAADKLVADKKPEEALEAYRSDYAANPQDDHALKMLIHLLFAKHSYSRDAGVMNEAMTLLVKLVELRPDANFAFNLADYYLDRSDWSNYNQYYALYLELNGQEQGSYDRSLNALALMYQGKLDEARQQYALAMEADPSHRFIGSYLAAELAAGQPLESVLELSKRYPEHSFGKGGYSWPLLIMELQAERSGNPEAFDKLLAEKLDAYMSRQDKALEQWASDGTPTAMKKFIKAVLEVS
ncbi:carboxypeptidase regulatory-like domain-containing protein [Paenibacillus camerounensis]|uniref:carboxypeptidase regulatory-like domain-containing protein n=1 Tax=Paenibacillus camerounensis TaxID=1243663 RepID=UPI0005A9EDD6|nr:carboxypeptidase regulatory-like domain-containing protein [Paenibacillus camerounensis]